MLPAGHDEVLLKESSLSFTTPIAQLLVGCTRPLEAVLDAFRCGTGVPFAAYGADMREGQARSSRILFDNLLASHWLPSCPTIHERLWGIRRPGSLTSHAVRAARALRSRAATREFSWTASTSTKRRLQMLASCCPRAALRIG